MPLPPSYANVCSVMRRQASELEHVTDREVRQTVVYLREVADFFDQAASVPPLVSEERSTDYVGQSIANSLDRALWLIENDLCCGVVADLGLLGWDSHIRNESKQAEMNGYFTAAFDEYMTELHRRSNRHGILAPRTVTIVGSELGRFPRQIDMLGQDHLPQTSFLFAGPGFRGGKSFGKTGAPDGRAAHRIPNRRSGRGRPRARARLRPRHDAALHVQASTPNATATTARSASSCSTASHDRLGCLPADAPAALVVLAACTAAESNAPRRHRRRR